MRNCWCPVLSIVCLVHVKTAFANVEYMPKFGTKTVYFHRPRIEDSLPWYHENIPPDLEILKIDATLRHGTRYPSEKRANKMEMLAPKFVHLISNKSSIKDWVSQFYKDEYNLLTKIGWEEHLYLGKKYYSMAPTFWLQSKQNRQINIMSSRKVRSLTSAKAFIAALESMERTGKVDFNHPDVKFDQKKVTAKNNALDIDNGIRYGQYRVQVNDTLLRFFDDCHKYVDTVTNNDTARYEYKRFFRTDVFRNISRDIIGPIEDPKEIFQIYLLCVFEMVNFNHSAWCDLFQERHIPYMEYAFDLKHYYKTGYGHAINHDQSCVLLRAIIAGLDNGSDAITLRFGHAETLIPLVSLLGFFNETGSLRADNFHEKMDRRFRCSKIGPFSGNLAIVLYSSRRDPSKKYISFVLNEYVIRPFGMDCHFCEYSSNSEARRELMRRVENCDSICKLSSPTMKDEL